MPRSRYSLTLKQRQVVFAKTNGHCHICGGVLDPKWTADHVVPHAAGGVHAVDNYLPACSVCNRLRWNFTPEDIRLILQLGIYARHEIKMGSATGQIFHTLHSRRMTSSQLRRKNRE